MLAGCGKSNNSSERYVMAEHQNDVEAIKQLAADWRFGWLSGDVDLLLSLYSDEPVLMPQDHPTVMGKDTIRAMYEPLLKEYEFESQGTVEGAEVSGDLGYLWISYTLTATPKAGGESISAAGKTIFIVKRISGGAWKITHLIDNSDGEIMDPKD